MPKKHLRTFAQGFRLMEKIGRTFPNTAENKGTCKWTHCPLCRGRLQVWRETNRGSLRVRCSTIGCFAMTERFDPNDPSPEVGETKMKPGNEGHRASKLDLDQ